MVPPPSQNTLFILYYINSRPATILKITDAPIPVCDTFYLTASFNCLNFSVKIFLLFLKFLLASDLRVFRLSTLVWFGCCNRCILACLLRSKTLNIPHQTTVYTASVHTELDSLAEVLIVSLMFPKPYVWPVCHLSAPKLQTCLRSQSDTVS